MLHIMIIHLLLGAKTGTLPAADIPITARVNAFQVTALSCSIFLSLFIYIYIISIYNHPDNTCITVYYNACAMPCHANLEYTT